MRMGLAGVLAFFLLAFASSALAEPATVVADGVAVLSEPTAVAETLTLLNRGDRVEIEEHAEGWVRIRVTLPTGFRFSGWVLDHFLEGVQDTPQPPVTSVRVPPSAATPDLRRDEFRVERWSGDRVELRGGIAYALFGYRLDRAGADPGKVFSYTLHGVGPDLSARVLVAQFAQDRLLLGLDAGFRYLFFRTTTRSRDASGAVSTTYKSNSNSMEVLGKAVLAYRLSHADRASALGMSAGYDFFSFSADDLVQDGSATRLFVSHSVGQFRAGPFGDFRIPSSADLRLRIGADALFLGSLRESPKNTTGTNPRVGVGVVPSASLGWSPWQGHRFSAAYEVRYQKQAFSGTASRKGSSNVVDGRVSNAVHAMIGAYAFSW